MPTSSELEAFLDDLAEVAKAATSALNRGTEVLRKFKAAAEKLDLPEVKEA